MTKSRHYWKEIASFKDQLSQAIPLDELRSLHERDARRHLLYAARQFGIVAACGIALWHLTNPLLWVPLAVLQGFTFFNMTTLLHEVVHNTVFKSTRHGWERALASLRKFVALRPARLPIAENRRHDSHATYQ